MIFEKEQNMDTAKRWITKGGELVEHPGWYKIDGRIEGESEYWSVVRKPDGTLWWVAASHIFPPGGGNLRLELGDQITEPKAVAQFEGDFIELLRKLDEKKMSKGSTPDSEAS
jgi:hypothetical protein